jgi:GTPase SAR1 family protein
MKTLIVGDVGAGKTTFSRRLLLEAVNQVDDLITVLDFAPPAQRVKDIDVGGYLLEDSHPKIRCLYSRLMKTPRLSAKDGYEVIRLASYNREITESLITKFLDSPTDTLFINDASIHLQQGNLRELLDATNAASTVVANGYKGSTLKPDHGSGVSERENFKLRQLAARMDRVIEL